MNVRRCFPVGLLLLLLSAPPAVAGTGVIGGGGVVLTQENPEQQLFLTGQEPRPLALTVEVHSGSLEVLEEEGNVLATLSGGQSRTFFVSGTNYRARAEEGAEGRYAVREGFVEDPFWDRLLGEGRLAAAERPTEVYSALGQLSRLVVVSAGEAPVDLFIDNQPESVITAPPGCQVVYHGYFRSARMQSAAESTYAVYDYQPNGELPVPPGLSITIGGELPEDSLATVLAGNPPAGCRSWTIGSARTSPRSFGYTLRYIDANGEEQEAQGLLPPGASATHECVLLEVTVDAQAGGRYSLTSKALQQEE